MPATDPLFERVQACVIPSSCKFCMWGLAVLCGANSAGVSVLCETQYQSFVESCRDRH